MPFGLKKRWRNLSKADGSDSRPNARAKCSSICRRHGRHVKKERSSYCYLEELFATIVKYNLKLNPDKCVFGVEAGKFLGFLLTERSIEANPEKCATIIGMRSLANVKEVQQLTGRMTALSRFLSASGDKGHPYFH